MRAFVSRSVAVFDGALRVSVVALWLLGALIAGVTATLAAGSSRRHRLARLCCAGASPWSPRHQLALMCSMGSQAVVTSLVLLGAQFVAAVGTMFELNHDIDASKSAELRRLGADPVFGAMTNLEPR